MYREIHRWNVLYLFVTSLGQTFTAELSCTLVVTWCYVTTLAEILSWIVMCVHMADPEAKVHRWIQLLDINSPRPTKFITEIGCHHAWADSLLNWLRLSICITFWRECRKCSGPTKMNFENSIVINRTCLYGFSGTISQSNKRTTISTKQQRFLLKLIGSVWYWGTEWNLLVSL